MGRTACTEPQCLYKGALYLYLYLYLTQHVTKFLNSRCKDKLSLDGLDKEEVWWRLINKAETIYLGNLFTCCVRLCFINIQILGYELDPARPRTGFVHFTSPLTIGTMYSAIAASSLNRPQNNLYGPLVPWSLLWPQTIPSTSLPHGHSVEVLSCEAVYCWTVDSIRGRKPWVNKTTTHSVFESEVSLSLHTLIISCSIIYWER